MTANEIFATSKLYYILTINDNKLKQMQYKGVGGKIDE